MFGLCDSATIALIVCIIVSVIVFVIAMIIGYKLDDSMEFAIICGFLSMIVCFLLTLAIVMTIQDHDVNKELKSSLSKNYPDYTDLAQCIVIDQGDQGDVDHSFRCNGQEYFCNFEYHNDKTLTVYTNDGAIDGVYVDGKKQRTESSSDQPPVVDGRITDKEIIPISKIQDKIFEKYDGAKITSFDMVGFTGTFVYKDDTYDFSLANGMLNVKNTSDSSDLSYYNVAN